MAMPLINRHRAGADLMFEKPRDYRFGIEGIYYGRRALDDNPYLTESKPYIYTMAIAVKQFGALEDSWRMWRCAIAGPFPTNE